MQVRTKTHLKRAFFTGIALTALFAAIIAIQLAGINGRLETQVIHSETLNEDRQVRVLLPASYGDTYDNQFDILYTLDGERFRFSHIVMLVAELLPNVPPLIVVSIEGQGKRMRDYSPNDAVAFDGRKIAGKADSFLLFIHEELMPFINRSYRVSGTNILSGHSMGGLFTTHAFIQNPTAFDGYLAFSPAYPAAIHTVERFQAVLQNTPDLKGYFYMNVGLERMGGYKTRFAEAEHSLETAASPGLAYTVSYTPLIHGAVMLPGYIEGLHGFYSRLQ